jgi:hypothetical protein
MPTLGAHFSDDEAPAVEAAAKVSPEKKTGPYIAEAVRQRMGREGMLPGNPHAELIAAADEVGVENAVAALKREARKRKHAA